MPEIVIASVAYASTAGPAIATITALQAAQAVLFVAGVANAQQQRRKAKAALQTRLQDKTYLAVGSAEPMQIVVGRTRATGVRLAAGWSWGPNKEVWSIPVAFAAHPVDAIEDIFIDGKSAGPFTAYDATTEQVTTGSRFYLASQEPNAVGGVPGGAVSATHTLAGGATWTIGNIVVVPAGTAGGEGAAGESNAQPDTVLVAGVDYSIATIGGDKRITWLTDQTGRTLTVNYVDQRGAGYLRVRKFLGNVGGERDLELETNSLGAWTSTDVGNAMTRVRLDYVWSRDIWPNGPGVPTAIIRGVKVYDPRADSTQIGGSGPCRFADQSTWLYTRNPALIWAWYMTWSGGGRRAFAKINWATVMTAANACDEIVTTDGGTQLRYTCDGVLSMADPVRENVRKILACMVGTRYYSQGKWCVRAGVWTDPVLDLTEDDLAPGDIQAIPQPRRREMFNTVRGLYTDGHPAGELNAEDPGGQWASTDYPEFSSSTHVTADGEVLEEQIDLPLVDDWRRARRIGKILVLKHRLSQRYLASWRWGKVQRLQPGNAIRYTSPTYDWVNVVFRVEDVITTVHGNVQLVLQADLASLYDWNSTEEVMPTWRPAPALPDPRIVEPLQNFSVTTGDAYTLPDGTVVPYCTVSWDAVSDSAVLSGGRIEVWWKRQRDVAFTQVTLQPNDRTFRIEPVSAGDTLQVYAWVFNGSQVRTSTPSYAQVIMRSDLPTGAATQPISANRLPSSMFSDGVLGLWGTPYGIGGTATSTVHVARHPSSAYYVSGPTSSVLLSIDDAYAGTGRGAVWPSALMPVDAGTRYCAFASLIGWESDCYVAIEWLDVSQGSLGVPADGNVIEGVPAESPSRRFNDPSHYQRSVVFADAPAGAAYARLLIVAGGTWTGGASKYIAVHQPYFGEIQRGIAIAPAWSPGSSDAVTTSQLASEAATIVRRATPKFGPIALTTINTGATPTMEVLIEADLRGMQIACTATMEVTITNTGGSAGVLSLAMIAGLDTDTVTARGPTRTLYRDSIAPGADFTRPVEYTESFEVLPESTHAGPWTARLWLGLKGALAAGPSATVSLVDFRVEVIKR